MIIIIPLGGVGKRFKDNGYIEPKALIEVEGKPIIFHLIDNLIIKDKDISFIYIPYNKEYQKYNFEEKIESKYPNYKFKFLCLEKDTRGAAETIYLSLKYFISKNKETQDKPILCLDGDNFYTNDIISEWDGGNIIFTFKNFNDISKFSYVKTNDTNNIIDIVEKEKISNNACVGAYGFKSYYTLIDYCKKIIDEGIMQKNEFYTSGVIKEMLNDEHSFKNIEILNKNYFSLGTPEQVNEYENPFIFDLDGTLVDTDDIYIEVWNNIMKKYKLSIDDNFFKFFIQGKNDILFLKTFFPNISDNEINEISIIKDELFIKYLKKYDKDIMIDGARNFMDKHKNRKMGVVTSCNRRSAEFILEKTKVGEYMQFLIASEDCNKQNLIKNHIKSN